MCAYCCGRRTRSVELLCAPIVVVVVRARWSCCARPLLTIDRPSEAPAWESAWYPGEAPGESGGSWLNSFSFPLLTFLGGCTLSPMSVVFPAGVFTRLRVLTRHPRTWGFPVIPLFSQSFSAALPYEGKCQIYGSRASLGLTRPRRSVASGSHQVAEVATRHW